MGRIQTVLGDVTSEELGRTLTHEHLNMEFTYFYSKPPEPIAKEFEKELSLKNVGYLRQYPHSSKWNLILNDNSSKQVIYDEIELYKGFGGGAIVENSTEGLKRDATFLKEVSKKTGVHIISGTGYYIAGMQEEKTLKYAKEELYNHMMKELTEGCVEDATVKAGFMGEIASVWPIQDFERKAIQAVGELQEQMCCGVSFHPHRVPEAPFEIIRLYLEAGGKADKAVMSHLDRTLLDDETVLEFSNLGTYCQYDLFGVEVSYYQLNTQIDMPSDSQRLAKIKLLIDEGKEDKILMSHDIHTKHRLASFGGHGYSHIINNVLPRMKTKGIPQETIDKITVENPARWLTINK